MSNMSHCRFENTANDLQDCLEAMQEIIKLDGVDKDGDALSSSELSAMHALIPMAEEFIELYGILMDPQLLHYNVLDQFAACFKPNNYK